MSRTVTTAATAGLDEGPDVEGLVLGDVDELELGTGVGLADPAGADAVPVDEPIDAGDPDRPAPTYTIRGVGAPPTPTGPGDDDAEPDARGTLACGDGDDPEACGAAARPGSPRNSSPTAASASAPNAIGGVTLP